MFKNLYYTIIFCLFLLHSSCSKQPGLESHINNQRKFVDQMVNQPLDTKKLNKLNSVIQKDKKLLTDPLKYAKEGFAACNNTCYMKTKFEGFKFHVMRLATIQIETELNENLKQGNWLGILIPKNQLLIANCSLTPNDNTKSLTRIKNWNLLCSTRKAKILEFIAMAYTSAYQKKSLKKKK